MIQTKTERIKLKLKHKAIKTQQRVALAIAKAKAATYLSTPAKIHTKKSLVLRAIAATAVVAGALYLFL